MMESIMFVFVIQCRDYIIYRLFSYKITIKLTVFFFCRASIHNDFLVGIFILKFLRGPQGGRVIQHLSTAVCYGDRDKS